MTTVTAPVERDERLVRTGLLRRLLGRPELGAAVGAIAVFTFFAVYTDQFATGRGIGNALDPAATLGIMAVVVALLMIGGEFDLSAGVMTASSGLLIAILTTKAGFDVWLALPLALLFGALIGLINGLLVVLQGLNLGVTKLITETVQISGVSRTKGYDSAYAVFARTFPIFGGDYRITIVWWIGVTAVATWVLLRTRGGNWIFAAGGNPLAARSVGVPAARTKVVLFITVSMTAALVGAMTVLRLRSVQANQGIGDEFAFIIAAVIGGCLLTGGYGSAIGATIGAFIFGMARQGIVFAGWDSDWFQAFLGVLLLLATMLNHFVRRRAEVAKR